MRVIAAVLMLVIGTIFLGGCQQSEQEKFYKQQNEDRKKADQEGQKAADSISNMDTSTKTDKKNSN